MTARPRISIVTPSFNQGAFVEHTLLSVLGQRYPDLEYIVMDGGSTDETEAILSRYRRHLTHLERGADGGQAAALNRGFARATGEIMAYLNSDDMLAPGTLDFVARTFAANPHVDMIYSHRVAVDAQNRAIWYWILPRHSDFLMRRWAYIPQETAFWRRSLYERAGAIEPAYRFAMDYDLFARFMAMGRLRRVDRFLAAFRVHADSKTTQLMGTLGYQEVARVRAHLGLTPRPWWRLIAHRFSRGIEWRGAAFAASGSIRPGNLPGLGWNYDRLWGGLLSDPTTGGL